MIRLRRLLLVLVASWLAWRVAAQGIAAYYVERIEEGDSGAAAKVLVWNRRHPEALYRRAQEVRTTDPDAAIRLLLRAQAENRADARPLLALAEEYQARGEGSRADELVEQAVRLTPTDPRIRQRAARYWLAQNRYPLALRHWSMALEADPQIRGQVFPQLLKLVEDPATQEAFQSVAETPPGWWEAFFELAAQRVPIDRLRALYEQRLAAAAAPVTAPERQAYVARLKREGLIGDAYVHWVNSLSARQRVQLGLLYDGGFEFAPQNWGFGWHILPRSKVLHDQAQTYGVQGEKALHLLFQGLKEPYRDLFQPLFLSPGPYRLDGRVRTDSLATQGGLQWRIACASSKAGPLGESERFLGSNPWRGFEFEFEVPPACPLQEIRLVSTGEHAFEYVISGGAWFDRMAIRKIARRTRPAPEKAERATRERDTTPEPAASPPPTRP